MLRTSGLINGTATKRGVIDFFFFFLRKILSRTVWFMHVLLIFPRRSFLAAFLAAIICIVRICIQKGVVPKGPWYHTYIIMGRILFDAHTLCLAAKKCGKREK